MKGERGFDGCEQRKGRGRGTLPEQLVTFSAGFPIDFLVGNRQNTASP